MADQEADKSGLDRSVLSYRDVSTQPESRFYLIVDEGMGQKALFAVDQVQVSEFEVVAYRDKPVITTVIRFSNHLPWRVINSSEVVLEDSRTVYEREAVEGRELHDMTARLRKELAPKEEEGTEGAVPKSGHGQYL